MKKDKDKDQTENPQDEQPKKDRSEETDNELVRSIAEKKYEFGFTTDIKTEIIEKGLNEDVVRLISAKKNEPEWLLDFRLKAFRYWQTLEQPSWGHVTLPEIDYQAISYYAAPTAPSQPPPKGGGASSQANPNSEASPSGGRLEGAATFSSTSSV